MKIFNLFFFFMEGLIRNISGGLGQRLRYLYYKTRLKKCGKNVRIDTNVFFENPENITLGDYVWINSNTIITARPLKYSEPTNRVFKKVLNKSFEYKIGEVYIGNQVSIGSFNIIQGFGGICIKDRVATGARVSLYSFSHHPFFEADRKKITYASAMINDGLVSCVESPIVIGYGVFIGINASFFGGVIGDYSFIYPHSLVLKSIKSNKIVAGAPARILCDRFEELN